MFPVRIVADANSLCLNYLGFTFPRRVYDLRKVEILLHTLPFLDGSLFAQFFYLPCFQPIIMVLNSISKKMFFPKCFLQISDLKIDLESSGSLAICILKYETETNHLFTLFARLFTHNFEFMHLFH